MLDAYYLIKASAKVYVQLFCEVENLRNIRTVDCSDKIH